MEVMQTDHVQLLPPGHVNCNKENITGLLKNNGFTVKDIVTMNPSLDLTYIRNEIEKESQSVSKKAAVSLFDLIFQESTFDSLQNSMRKNRMGGNMVVVAKRMTDYIFQESSNGINLLVTLNPSIKMRTTHGNKVPFRTRGIRWNG